MASDVPNEIVRAAEHGYTAVVQRWLANGGDPNQDVQTAPPGITYWPNFRILLLAAANGRTDIVRLLLEHGADVNYVFKYPAPVAETVSDEDDMGDNFTALDVALTRTHNVDLIRLLLDNGANSRIVVPVLLRPRIVRMLLVAGADVSARSCHRETPETWIRQFLAQNESLRFDYQRTLDILEGTRLAGSYKNYVLQEFRELLRLRSLLARNRARINDQAPEVVARLFGGRTGGDGRARVRPPARRCRARPLPPRTAGVPDPAFWLVIEYWRLGDWRHP